LTSSTASESEVELADKTNRSIIINVPNEQFIQLIDFSDH
jgi:hypothetical protein